MAFKFIIFSALVAMSNAAPVVHEGHHLVIAEHGHHDHGHDHVEHHAPANYEFEYSVHDHHTGDIKSQHETRHGDSVVGHYSLVEPDGHRRVVHYTADKHNGFNAEVHREGTSHPAQTHHVAPVAVEHHVAPVAIAHHVAPVTIAHHHVAPVAISHHVAHHVAHPVAVAHHEYHHAAPVHHVATSHSSIQHHHTDYHH